MTTIAPAETSRPAAPGRYPRRWLAAVAMMIAVLMDMIDVTIVNVALPTIRRDLGASATQLEWVVSAYMLAFAAALITAGSLGDLLGRKRLFLAGIATFGLASLAAGLAQAPGELIAARVVQGAAAAVMTPQLLATFRTVFDAKERGQAFGLYGAILGFASAIGLLLGGVLTSANLFGWSWRSVFFVNVPIALVSLVLSARFVPETRERSARRSRRCCALGCCGSRRSPPVWESSSRSQPGSRGSSWPSRSGCRPGSTTHRCVPGSPRSHSARAASHWPRSRSRWRCATAAGC